MLRQNLVSPLLVALLISAAAVSMLAGDAPLSLSDIARWLAGSGAAIPDMILGEIRAPRIVLAAFTGFVLGLAGAAVQAFLRNPLAEPSLLGASNCAALGAVIVIYLGLSGTLSYGVPVAACLAALVSVLLLLAFAGRGVSSLRLILAGFAVSALAGAGISLVLNLAPNAFAALEIAFWLLGGVENRNWEHVYLALPGGILGCMLLLWRARALDALVLEEDVAQSLGVNLEALRLRLALGLALGVGSVVAVTGVIGFVGLVAPHLVRPFTGHLPSRTLIAAGLLGAVILVLADGFVRAVPTQAELKMGVVTAFLGVPMLLYLIRRTV
ncbi:MAG: iron ABC transporter permease [Rhizobiales bacterium TMED83]|nr:ABC transporter permease [Rhodobiaceae bacterium]RPF92351.1 MAG: iron ABC transporter permease [Rhizobiales bacterium TMED83]